MSKKKKAAIVGLIGALIVLLEYLIEVIELFG